MNKDKVLKFADTIFNDISQVGGNSNLFRGLLNIDSQKPAGIYYIDFNADIKVDNFDDYQDKVLSDEYYSHSDSLQWNLYLLFLQDSVDAKTKSVIERNDKYGRKYFFTESEFEDFFRLNKSDAEITTDIVLQWKQRLNEADLQEVHMKTKYTEAVDNFLNNTVPKAPPIETKKNTDTGKTFNFINTITLANNYREFPKQPRTFSFGKMNLVKGSNGVGKTSLFEAIELITCGKTARNSDKKENDNCISATVDNSKEAEVCQPSNNEKYRLRDAYWYGRTYPKDNFCYTSFNRFNFFNTDAANDFANTNQESEVKTALSNIILGEEFNYLSGRIPKFASYLKPHYNQLKQSLDDAKQKINKSSEVINRLKSSNSTGPLKEAVNVNLASIKFLQPGFALEKDLAKIEELSNSVKAITDKLVQNSFSRSYKDLKHYSEVSQKKKKLFDDFQSQYRELNKNQGENEQRKQALEGKKSLLIDCLKYFQDRRYFDIQFHDNQLKKIEEKVKNIHFVKGNIKDRFSGLNGETSLFDLITAENKELQSLNAKSTENEIALKEILSHLDELDKIVKEIKSLGSRFLDQSISPTFCPLCETKFEENQLFERISHIANNAPKSDKKIEDLYSKRQEYQNAINRCRSALDYLQSIEKIASRVLSSGASQNSLNRVLSEITELTASEAECEKQLQELREFFDRVKEHHVSVQEFIFLPTKLSIEFGDLLTLKFENKRFFDNEFLNIGNEIEKTNYEIEEIVKRKQVMSQNIRSVLEIPSESSYTLGAFEKEMVSEELKITDALSYFQKLRSLCYVNDDTEIADLSLAIDTLDNNIESLKREYQGQTELRNAETELHSSQKFIQQNSDKFERIEKAMSVLNSISSQNGDEQLNTFFNENLKEITDIFKTVHSPREYTAIVYRSNQLLLQKGAKFHRITEISTGQRAALALSIFISLNRKLKKGPNIIMFDDPVSHIDDLNALSFLDFLRFFILRENKQIFFSTANYRLASLIEKKFEFLENDFKKWELVR